MKAIDHTFVPPLPSPLSCMAQRVLVRKGECGVSGGIVDTRTAGCVRPLHASGTMVVQVRFSYAKMFGTADDQRTSSTTAAAWYGLPTTQYGEHFPPVLRLVHAPRGDTPGCTSWWSVGYRLTERSTLRSVRAKKEQISLYVRHVAREAKPYESPFSPKPGCPSSTASSASFA